MNNTQEKDNDLLSPLAAVVEGAEGAEQTEQTLSGDLLPTSEELSRMSEQEREQTYKRIMSALDDEVEQRVSALSSEYQRGIADFEDASVRGAFASSEKFSGFGESIAAIDTLIEKVPVLKTLPSDEKYTVAYLINEGIKARESREGMSAESLLALVSSRPDVMRMLEAQRTRELSDAYRSTPVFSASGGSSSMPANIKNTPRNLDEASREAYSSFGIKI